MEKLILEKETKVYKHDNSGVVTVDLSSLKKYIGRKVIVKIYTK